MTDDERTPAQKIRAYLAGNPATEHHHRSILGGFKFTDGILFVAETAGAFWLVDAVASYQPQLKDAGYYQFWRLECGHTEGLEAGEPDPGPWVLSAWTDVPHESKQLARQELHSDFPRELSPFDVWVEGGVMLLPAEH